MTDIFKTVFNMSVTSCYVIAAVLLIRLFISRLPKKYSYMLWLAVGFRLTSPFTFQEDYSLFSLKIFDTSEIASADGNVLEYIPQTRNTDTLSTGISGIGNFISNSSDTGLTVQKLGLPVNFINVISYIWLAVAMIFLVYGIASFLLLKRKMSSAVLLRENIYQSDKIGSPFILGFIKPKIYIPFDLDEKTYHYVAAHEKHHIKRGDTFIKLFAFILLAVHWFNPLCYVAFYLLTRDMEMSCDEAVLNGSNADKKEYSSALLSFSIKERHANVTPLCFSENSVSKRIKNVLRHKKPKKLVSILISITCCFLISVLIANPVTSAQSVKTIVNANMKIGSDLDEFLSSSILDAAEKGRYLNEDGEMFAESHILLENRKGDMDGNNEGKYSTAFLLSHVTGLVEMNGILYEDTGSLGVCGVTYGKTNGKYTLKEIWYPRDGDLFYPDIESCLSKSAMINYNDINDNINEANNELYRENFDKVIKENDLDANKYIARAFKNLADAIPSKADLNTYLNSYLEEDGYYNYECLNYLGEYTLEYVYEKFLEGGQTGVYAALYGRVLDDLLGEEKITSAADSAQEHFDIFLNYNRDLLKRNGEKSLKKNNPCGYLLLQMSGDIK